jgi:hypothetical protein
MSQTRSAPAPLPCQADPHRAARRLAGHAPAVAAALLLALACADASAVIRLSVQADFPASGFADGPVWGTSSAQSFQLDIDLDEAQAVHHAAGFEVLPGRLTLAHDVYAFSAASILRASSFSFGNQVFRGTSMHNLSFALLDGGLLAAPLFVSDIQPGATPLVELGLGPGFLGLGGYDATPFAPGVSLGTVFLTNQASAWDGSAQALGSVSAQVTAVPEPAAAALLLPGLLVLAGLAGRRRPDQRAAG